MDEKLEDTLDALEYAVKDLPDQLEAAFDRATAAGDRTFAAALAQALGNLGRSVPTPPPAFPVGPPPPQPPPVANPFPAGMGGFRPPPPPPRQAPPAGWPGGPAGPPPPGAPLNYNPFPAGMTPTPPTPPAPPKPPPGPWPALGAGLGAVAGNAAHGMNARPNNPLSGLAHGAANAAGTVSQVAMVVPGGQVVAGIAKGLEVALKAGGAVADSVVALRHFAEATNEANKRLAAYNPTIMFSQMQLAFGDFKREFQLGRRTQDTAAELARNVDKMRDAWQGFDAFRQNNENRAGSFGAGVNEEVGRILSGLADRLEPIIGWVDKNGDLANDIGKVVVDGVVVVAAALATAVGGPAAGAAVMGLLPAGPAPKPPGGNLAWHDEFDRIAKIGPIRKARVVPNP